MTPDTPNRCDDYCSNYGCNNGQHCPARQACQLPDEDPPLRMSDALWAVGLVAAAALVAITIFP